MRDAYRERRDRAVEVAAAHGLDVFRTQGTFYMLVDVSPSGLPAREFTLRLLDELHVAVAPGEVFGPGGEGLVRISFAVEADVLAEGMARIARAIETLRGMTARGRRAARRVPARAARRARRVRARARRDAEPEPARRRAGGRGARRRRSCASSASTRVETAGASEERPNLLAHAGGAGGRTLILGGHLDTKPPGDLARVGARPVRRGGRGRRAARRRLRAT